MLEMRANCESCSIDLSPSAVDVFICSYECTFCGDCAASKFDYVCPNCGGKLVQRPTRDDNGT